MTNFAIASLHQHFRSDVIWSADSGVGEHSTITTTESSLFGSEGGGGCDGTAATQGLGHLSKLGMLEEVVEVKEREIMYNREKKDEQ